MTISSFLLRSHLPPFPDTNHHRVTYKKSITIMRHLKTSSHVLWGGDCWENVGECVVALPVCVCDCLQSDLNSGSLFKKTFEHLNCALFFNSAPDRTRYRLLGSNLFAWESSESHFNPIYCLASRRSAWHCGISSGYNGRSVRDVLQRDRDEPS